MRPHLKLVVFVLFVAGTTHCASAPPLPRSVGDVSFRLTWSGSVDLDLHVRSPLGEDISLDHRTVPSGGELSYDCNATPETMCASPVEIVYWPRQTAPTGVYRYTVRMFNLHESTFPVTFVVEVLRGNRVVDRRENMIEDRRENGGPWEFAFNVPRTGNKK